MGRVTGEIKGSIGFREYSGYKEIFIAVAFEGA